MPVFPTCESEIDALARQMLAGYALHAGDFPHVRRNTLLVVHRIYQLAARYLEQRQAAWCAARAARQESFTELKRIMKECLKRSEVDTAAAPEKLTLIGWGPRRKGKDLTAPAAPRNLRLHIAPGTVRLTWQPPTAAPGTGPVSNYLIERRELFPQQAPRSWQLLTAASQTAVTLTGQPHGIRLEYQVRSANAAGKSLPSNPAAFRW